MEGFTSDFQRLDKPAASFSELNSNMELLNNLSELNQPLNSHVHGILDYLQSGDNGVLSIPVAAHPTFSNEPQFPFAGTSGRHQNLLCPYDQTNNVHVSQSLPSIEGDIVIPRSNKGTLPISEFLEMPSSPGFGSESGGNDHRIEKNDSSGARKRKRKNDGNLEKPKEVIHVRAKRGQATDSHSLAERVRRERINEKLKVLQDLVPGCYKTMGMAVMLDVIINYVRSLQNQIEFLSMKLSAASLFYDFNSPEAEALEVLQKTTNAYEAHDQMEGMQRKVHPSWPF